MSIIIILQGKENIFCVLPSTQKSEKKNKSRERAQKTLKESIFARIILMWMWACGLRLG